MHENKKENFIPLATTPLAHWFANCIGLINANINDELKEVDKKEVTKLLEKFIFNVEKVIKETKEGKLRIDSAVSMDEIQEVLDIAKSITDASDPLQIKKLYDKHEPINNKRSIQ